MIHFDAMLTEQIQKASVFDSSSAPVHITSTPEKYRPLTRECFIVEAKRQNLEPWRLLAVLKQENGRVGMFRRNSDGSYDIGPMQVNTIHLTEMSKVFKIPPAQAAQLLAYDGCFNVAVGAWLLRTRTNEVGGNFWYGIGRYHSKNSVHSNKYILEVHQKMMEIVGTPG